MRPKPLLASEVLRDEAAPIEPARRAARVWLIGAALVLGGSSHMLGWGSSALGWAGALGVLGALGLPYGWRALSMLLAGALPLLGGLRSTGPMAGWFDAAPEPWRLVAALALPAAIWVRGHYRHYWAAHVVFASGLLLAVPYAWHGSSVLVGTAGPWAQLAALCSLGAVLVALFALVLQLQCWFPACLALLGIGAELGLNQLSRGFGTAAARTAAYLALASVAALGVFQLFSRASAARARRGVRVTPDPEEELEQRISVG